MSNKRSVEEILWAARTKRTMSRKHKKYRPDKVPRLKALGYEYFSAPVKLDLYSESNHKDTIEFIDNLLEKASKSPVMLDFEETEHISAAALLYFYSRIDSFLASNSLAKLRIKEASLTHNVKNAIRSSGLIERTLNRERKLDSRYINLPIIKGTAQGEEFEEVIDHIINKIFISIKPEDEKRIGAAVSETVGNVKLHAYPHPDNENKPWWVMCSFFNGSLYLAIYDEGVGIPKTIHDRPWIKSAIDRTPEFFRKFTNGRDVDLISISMEAGKTQTKEKNTEREVKVSKLWWMKLLMESFGYLVIKAYFKLTAKNRLNLLNMSTLLKALWFNGILRYSDEFI
ncbi:hypothetical protein [Pseudoalteromonas sp. BSi20439]|uniref:hypothetical protein n=1 Tax=Pseudoalteromonas sp. BSi20439 TaxID=420915 RepID=UPI000231B7AA|nr:hypothetical protein [Pseudoalteromonas sp. BSi20439]GAA72641.1 hypothetical protein P20439_2735 [Pseudoalteromonas sp. BSi20439]